MGQNAHTPGPKPVTVTMYTAKDGSLHKSPEAAVSHDKYVAQCAIESAIENAISGDVRVLFARELERGWPDLDHWERGNLITCLARLIAEHFNAIEKAVQTAAQPASEGE